MSLPFTDIAFFKYLESILTLKNIRPVCKGMVRAKQELHIANELICTDEVLVEEVQYNSPGHMAPHVQNLSIKIGQFAPFLPNSTYPPKYCYPIEKSASAFYVSSIPTVSLAAILAEVSILFPPKYTINSLAYYKDYVTVILNCIKRAWLRKKYPLFAFKMLVKSIRSTRPKRILKKDKIQLAADILSQLERKHDEGLYHNNITKHTVFYNEPDQPMFLNNFTGVNASTMESIIPKQILKRDPGDTYGEESVDVYSAALLCYEILTGEAINGPLYALDSKKNIDIPESLHDRFSGLLVFLNLFLAMVRGFYYIIIKTGEAFTIPLDPSRCAYQKKLCCASGSWIRSVPVLGDFLNIWFPTLPAMILIAVLDEKANRRLFGPDSAVNRRRREKCNVNIAYLKNGFPKKKVKTRSLLSRSMKDIIDLAHKRPPFIYDDEPLPAFSFFLHPLFLKSLTAVLLVAAIVVMLLEFIGKDNENLPFISDSTTAQSIDKNNEKMNAAPNGETRSMGKSETVQNMSSPSSIPSEASAPTKKTRRQKKKPLTAKKRTLQKKKNPAQSRHAGEQKNCEAILEPVKGYPKVFVITHVGEKCSLGDVLMDVGNGKFKSLREMADSYTKYFIAQRKRDVYSSIIAVRKCSANSDSCEEGEFYTAFGYRALGKKVIAGEGDLLAFNSIHLRKVINKLLDPQE